MDTTKITWRAALVTGASTGGIGHATAVALAKIGHKVAVTSKTALGLADTLEDMIKAAPAGIKATDHFMALEVDFLDPKQLDQVIDKVIAKFGQLDILVNNAGMLGQNKGLIDEGFYENFQDVMQVNLMAPTRLAQLAAPHLLKATGRTGGVIINISTIADLLPVACPAYSISKAGLNMLTKSLATCFEGTCVRTITVRPGPTATKFETGMANENMGKLSTLARRSGTANEIAGVIEFLISDKASYMTGTTVDVDGGAFCKAGLLITDACIQGCLPVGVDRVELEILQEQTKPIKTTTSSTTTTAAAANDTKTNVTK